MLTPRGKLVVPQKYLPFLGAGAAVVATLAYILWGPDFDRRGSNTKTSKRRKVAGLENLGNTCYLNTILQSLAACPAFVKWLSRALRQGFFKGKHNELAYKLSKTLEVVNDHSASPGGAQVYSPHEVLHALYSCSWRADKGQQDAHELFQFLLSVLGEEKEPVPSPVPLCDTSRFIEPGRNGLTALHSDLHSNIEANLPKVVSRDGESTFRGLLANHLSCTVCGYRNPVTYSSFDCLTLPIPATVFGTLSLESILAKFTQRELVHDVECTECSKELSGKTSPSSRRTAKKISPPTWRGHVPPTPKHVPTASTTSVVASSAVPVSPPSCGTDPPPSHAAPPTSHIASPTSQIAPPPSPSTLPPPNLVTLATDSHPASTAVPPTLGLAAPTLGLATPTSDRESVDCLMRTLPPSDSVTGSYDLPIKEKIDDSVDVPAEGAEDNESDLVTNCHNDNIATDISPGAVVPTETNQECVNIIAMENSTDICNEMTGSEMTGSDCTQNLSGDLTQIGMSSQDLNKARSQAHGQTFDADFVVSSAGEASTQTSTVQTEHQMEPSTETGRGKDLAVKAMNSLSLSPSADTVTETREDHRMSPMTACESVPKERQAHSNQDQSNSHHSNIPKEKPTDKYSLTARHVSSSNVAPPKWQSTPKPRPSPLREASSSANHIQSLKATPTLSIFGRIPGSDGMTLSPPEVVGTKEDLSLTCRRIFRKQLTIGKLPQCLCIHLQRVTWLANGLPSRREEHVIFPEYLDMSPYKQTAAASSSTQSGAKLIRLTSDISEDGATPLDTRQRRKSSHGFIGGSFLSDNIGMSLVGGGLNQMSPRVHHNSPRMAEQDSSWTRETIQNGEDGGISEMSSTPTEARYRLASAVVHQGDAYSGHFLTFRRAPSIGNEPLSDNWLCVSDESVYTSTTKEVLSQKAYMLYYQRT